MNDWIDITRPIDETLVNWPGRKGPQQTWERRIETGHHCNVSAWQINSHCGTHMDAPLHFVDSGKPIDQIQPQVFIGPCEVIDLSDEPEELFEVAAARGYEGTQRLLLKSSHSRPASNNTYRPHNLLMTDEAAEVLVSSGLLLVGTDRLSVDDSRGECFSLHHRLLSAGCVIVEGLQLADVKPGSYELFAAPLRLTGGEASPVRAFLRRC